MGHESTKKRSQTLVFVALLSFVGILAPVVYHQQHMHHPVVRRQRNERVVRGCHSHSRVSDRSPSNGVWTAKK
jgi:hypothetical protein